MTTVGGGGVPPTFPANFLKGIALSVFQNSGDLKSNWTDYIKKKNYLGHPEHKAAFAKASDFWNMYESDIKAAKALGANSFRFCFEWARFEPDAAGKQDEEAFVRYRQIIDCIIANGMEPMATLHHFVHPSWFEALGGFAKEENIPYFVDYCVSVFQRFGSRFKLWSTFNEPTCFAFVGYIVGLWCPGELGGVSKCGRVLLNLLKAHCAAYRALKQQPGGQQACVGLVHQHICFVPRHNLPHVRWLCKWMTFWFGISTILKFFTTGVFEWEAPFTYGGPRRLYTDERVAAGERVIDWWGINYYSRPSVHWNFSMGASADNEPVSDTDFRLYPQGLYDSIAEAGVLKVPIYITEFGLADKADKNRGWYAKAALDMVLKSVADGHDVRGCFWWTLMDNIEWHEGFHIKFGLYEWDPSFADKYKDTNNRPPEGLKLREGAKPLRDTYLSWPNLLGELRKFAKGAHGKGGSTPGAAPSSPAREPAVLPLTKPDDGGVGTETIELIAASGTSAK